MDIDDKWSSQEWNSGATLAARTGRPVGGQQFTQDADKFVINDDDMDSDTATESNFSLEFRSFLQRENDRLRKILDHYPKDAMQDIEKRFFGNVYVFDSGSICIHVKGLLRQFALQKDREQSHVETDVGHIWEVSSRTIRWDFGVSQISWEDSW